MKQVVIMPGGFHPFHAGHYALYQQAQQAFPNAEVYVAATNDTSARPFPFAVKEKLAKLAGVEPGHFVQVKSPFQAREITGNYEPEDTQLIFVRSQKDADKPPQAGGVKRDGTPAYLQLLKGQKELAPMSQHAYMAYLPTVEFGPGMTSATEIRTAWTGLNERRKTALVMSLYPKTQKNPKLAATVVKMLDTAIGTTELNEAAEQEFILYINGKPAAKYTNLGQAEQDLLLIKNKVPTAKFEIKQEVCNMVSVPVGLKEALLREFAPSDGDGRPKFIPWSDFIEGVKGIVGKDFEVVENVVKSTIKARFVPIDPLEYGPTMLYSYYETRAGRGKGAVSTRGAIQVGRYYPNSTALGTRNFITSFNILKGHPFERHFDLTPENISKIAAIIMGNTEGAYRVQPQGVAEDYVDEKK